MPQPTATRPAVVSRPSSSVSRPQSPVSRPQSPDRRNGYAGPRRGPPRPGAGTGAGARPIPGAKVGFKAGLKPGDKPEHEILFQQYFKSANPQRTYAAQVKKANNGNHYLVLTEGKRDDSTGEIRKTRVFLYGEDFIDFFKMLQSTAQFIRANPVPDEVRKKRDRLWAKKNAEPAPPRPGPASAPS